MEEEADFIQCPNCGRKNIDSPDLNVIKCDYCNIDIFKGKEKKTNQTFLDGTKMEVDKTTHRKICFYRCQKCYKKIYAGQLSHVCKGK
jgi:hypothetical protein